MTPDPPPAAPLTAEEIAAIRDAYERHCVVVFMGDTEAADRAERDRLLYTEMNNLLLSDAALRDRLKRAEERCGVMGESLREVLGDGAIVITQGEMSAEQWGAFVQWATSLPSFATPTNGAARAGDTIRR